MAATRCMERSVGSPPPGPGTGRRTPAVRVDLVSGPYGAVRIWKSSPSAGFT